MDQTRRISVVIPAYNEESNFALLRQRLTALFDGLREYEWELFLVDDHSSDRTPGLTKAWADEDRRVRLIRLSRNFGSHAAFNAGLAQAKGDAVVFLAADLQDPPEFVPHLIRKWREGSDVVWALRVMRQGWKTSERVFSRLYYYILRKMALADMPPQGADFLLMDRKVVEAYKSIAEKNTSFLCMVLWMGFKQSFVSYEKEARASGRSKWTFSRKVKLFVDSLVSFSFTPIRAMSVLGVLFALAGFLFAVVVAVGRLAGWIVSGTGYAALMTVLLVGFGLTMLMLGVIGEYLWRTFDEARGRPRYIVEEEYPAPGPREQARGSFIAAGATGQGNREPG